MSAEIQTAVVGLPTTSDDVQYSDEVDDEQSDGEDCRPAIGRVLSTVPPVLERVLVHLPMKDLNRCSQVCHVWSQVTRLIKRRRQRFFWMFWAEAGRRKLPPAVCSSCSITEHVRHVLNTAASEPKLGLLFATNSFFEEQGRFAEESSSSDTPVIDYLVSALPRDCLLLGTCSSGMIGTTLNDNGRSSCVEVESTEGFSCLLLPNMPGMQVYPFIIKNAEDLADFEGRDTLNEAELHRLTKVPVEQRVKCLLLFCSHVTEGENGARLVAESLLRRSSYQMALGGGFVDTFVAPRYMLSPHIYLPHTMGIAICGDRVRAASVVLTASVRKRKGVEKALEQLKQCNFPVLNSFGMLFACVGRGKDFYGESNVEADVFQKLFPDTPLFGFFGNGEIGMQYVPKAENGEPEPKRRFSFAASTVAPSNNAAAGRKNASSERVNIFHGYTSIVVLVSVEKS